MIQEISRPPNDFLKKSGQANRCILLADDDSDDCLLFKQALSELEDDSLLTIVNSGEQLMHLLCNSERLPDLLFMDLNMPRKNGLECLSEIKKNKNLTHLPVIIISTSFDIDTVDLLRKKGARHYIRKPNEFGKLKEAIHRVLQLNQAQPEGQTQNDVPLPEDCFVLSQ